MQVNWEGKTTSLSKITFSFPCLCPFEECSSFIQTKIACKLFAYPNKGCTFLQLNKQQFWILTSIWSFWPLNRMELILLHSNILPISTPFSFQSKCDQRILNLEILSWICILIFQFNYSVFFFTLKQNA